MHGALPINRSTSSAVTGANCSNVGVIRDGTSYSGVDAQDARIESTLSLKKAANSSAVCAPASSMRVSLHEGCSRVSSCRPCQLLFHSASNRCFSARIALNLRLVIQARLSTSQHVRLNRRSVARVCRRAARHSASNHGRRIGNHTQAFEWHQFQ